MKFDPTFAGAILCWIVLSVSAHPARCSGQTAQSPADTQEMSDFSLSGFGDKGVKAWDVRGKSADIGTEVIKLNRIVSNFYGEQETVQLTARTGSFNRREGSIHLQDDVVVTTSSGARLETDVLDWDRKRQLVKTDRQVNVYKGSMTATGRGAKGFPDLNKFDLDKDVKVVIDEPAGPGKAGAQKVEITSDGPLQVDYQKNIATFNDHVKTVTADGVITCDQMELYFGAKQTAGAATRRDIDDIAGAGSKIERILCFGNVTITRGPNVSYSESAVYSAPENKITLLGRPKMIIYSSEGLNAPVGN
ncbi:MAG TPA: LPS export ABC transporter periplasmic protein LptC [Candidatus Omnitrophota bacterium]|nr:LPS export ABC transporter periplasmic protein LptC [Candidatus Omnitrophota bacterium]HQQ05593.1 LPS export ABC transporter periplasmic protein LptC [Candidatus Omnitrophota bacterium]